MSSNHTISTEAQVLLKLLRLALGTEPLKAEGSPVEPFPDNVDWAEVIRLSYEQKVSALTVDGLNASKYDLYEGLNDEQAKELRQIITPWIDDVREIEQSYGYYVSVLTTLCQIFVANGLKPVILKGYGLSLNYPVPSHRGAGDIDIVVLDENDKLATERALDIIENQLKIQTKKVPHDYEFTFKGLEVELHYDATNPYWNTKEEKYITNRLTEMLPQGITPCPNIPNAYVPSATFNALYLIRHCFGHFYTVSGNLRQYVDWVTFVKAHHNEIDWNKLGCELGRTTMKPFFDGLATMLGRWLRLDTALCPISDYDIRTEQFILKDAKQTISEGVHFPQYIRYLYFNRYKLKFISGKSWIYFVWDTILSIINNRFQTIKSDIVLALKHI